MTMTVDSARKILNIAAVIHIICGIPMIVVGILGISGTAAASVAPEIADSLAEAGPMTAGVVMALSAVILVTGFLATVEGVLARRAVKDPAKVDDGVIRSSGVAGIIRPGKNSVQVVIGTTVQFVADEMKKMCAGSRRVTAQDLLFEL